MIKHKGSSVFPIFAFMWIAVIVISYFVTHKPVTPSLAITLAKVCGQIVVPFSIVAISGGLGVRLLPRIDFGSLTNLSLRSALGLGVLGILMLIFGSLLGINPVYSALVMLIMGLLLWRDILQWARSWRNIQSIFPESDRFGRLIGFGVVLILLATLFTALAPPLKFDALVYHLTLPQIYINNGQIIYVPEIMFWGMPQLGEILYTWAISLGGIESATILGWMFGILALVGLYGYASERFSSRTAWIALVSLLGGYTLAVSLAWGYVDWLTMLYGLGVFICLDMWRHDAGRKYLLVAGIFVGLGLSVKYTAGILLVAGLGVIIYQSLTSLQEHRRSWVYALSFILAAFFVTLPWLIKNILGTGNPIYPFIFPSGSMDNFRQNFYQLPRWGNWQDILLLPLRATFVGVEGSPGYSASIGPFLLALSPLAFWNWSIRDDEQRTTITTAALIGLIGIVVWVMAGQVSVYLIQSRLYLSIFPALAVLAGVGFDAISKIEMSGIRFGRVLGVLILFVFGLTVLEVGVGTLAQGATKALMDLRATEDYIGDNLGWYGPAMKAIRELPEDELVLMLWEPRSLYCIPKCISDESLDRWVHDRHMYGEASTILEVWRDLGYTHVLYFQFGADFIREEDTRYTSSDWETLEELLGQLPPPTDFGGAYYLYSIEP